MVGGGGGGVDVGGGGVGDGVGGSVRCWYRRWCSCQLYFWN